MRRLAFIVIIMATQSHTAWAVVDVEVLAGRGAAVAAEAGGPKTSAADLTSASLHIAPLPLVPVAIGAAVTNRKYVTTFGGHEEHVTRWTAGPEIMMWIPGFALSPYLKVSTSVVSKFTATSSDEVRPAQTSSPTYPGSQETLFGGGLKWSPVPVFALLGEYRQNIRDSSQRTVLLGLGAEI